MRFAWIEPLMFSLLIASAVPAFAADEGKDADSAQDKDKKKDEKPIPPEKTSVSHGSVDIGGRAVRYSATAGTVLIRDDKEDKPEASVFYVAYTADDAKGSNRPITFFYNGGPGSSSVWLHMGSLAPVRVESASAVATAPPPYHLVPNQYSLIDKSDLVFIDAVGTGFSTPVGKAKGKDFWGVDQDLSAFAKAITRYVTINQRWNSPKFLFGESYGTTRSAGLVNKLQGQGMAFNGVVLLSSILNYASNSPGLDQNYIGSLPTFAAIAWYHDKVPGKPASMEAFVNEARAFATGEYASALAKGQSLTPAEEDALATKLSRYTGLSPAVLEGSEFPREPEPLPQGTAARRASHGRPLRCALRRHRSRRRGRKSRIRRVRHRDRRRIHGGVQQLRRRHAEVAERRAVQDDELRHHPRVGLEARAARLAFSAARAVRRRRSCARDARESAACT